MQDYVTDYLSKGIPVIITGLNTTTRLWDMEHVAQLCGSREVVVMQKTKDRSAWAGLAPQSKMSLGQFIQGIQGGSVTSEEYLFDWPLQEHCPELLQGFKAPRYLAQDVLTAWNISEHWPSLLVGPAGSQSGLHTDAWDTHFWMCAYP